VVKGSGIWRRFAGAVRAALVAASAMLLVSCAELQAVSARDRPLFCFVHLTDTHCVVTDAKPEPPPLRALIRVGGFKFYWSDLPNSLPNLEHAVAYLNEVVRPDFVIHTGDISGAGRLEDLQRARKILDKLACPYYVIMGDNDVGMKVTAFQRDPSASNFARVFGRHNRSLGRGGWRFILLSACPAPRDFAWLERELAASEGKPTFLCTHRLVMADRFTKEMVAAYYRGVRLTMVGAKQIEAMLEKRPNVRFILSGHCHCSLEWEMKGRYCFTTAALVGVPIEFRLFTVYSDRVEVRRYGAPTAADARAGRWRIASTRLILLDRGAVRAPGPRKSDRVEKSEGRTRASPPVSALTK